MMFWKITVLTTVQWRGVYSAAYGTVHYIEPLKSFVIRGEHSLGFGLPSVAILHDCAESAVKLYSYTYIRFGNKFWGL